MILVFSDGYALNYDFGIALRGIHHRGRRPIAIIVSQLEMDQWRVPKEAPEGYNKQTYIDTILKPAIDLDGQIHLGRWNQI